MPRRPVGYIRAKMFNRSVLIKTLIDSGNLFADLISADLARKLKLKISGNTKKVGTANSQGTVTILGRTNPIKLYLEGVQQPVQIHPYVVQDLAHPLNLGQAFLRENNVDMSFRSNGVVLRLGSHCTKLHPSDAQITRPTIDHRIQQVLDKLKDQGGNPSVDNTDVLDLRINEIRITPDDPMPGVNYGKNKSMIEWSETRRKVYSADKIHLKPGCMTVIPVSYSTQDSTNPKKKLKERNEVYLSPRANVNFLNKNSLFVHPGCYRRDGNETKVLVSNFGNQEVVLPKFCTIGYINESTGYIGERINLLDHRPQPELTEAEVVERRSYLIKGLKLDENPLLNNEPELKEEVLSIFMDNWDAVSVNEADFGKTNLMKFHIKLAPDAVPSRSKLRPLNPAQEEQLKKQLEDWTTAGVIEPSNSAWSAALVPCKKKNSDKIRFACDYRKLNLLTVKDAYPLSSIEGNLHKLEGAQIFSTLDSSGAFHCLEMDVMSRDYTAFVTPFGQFRFTRLPFGLANAPASYSRLVQMALDRLPSGFALGYIDDIIIYSQNLREHIDHLRQIVSLHANVGMKLNVQKCALLQPEVEYLGHLVSTKGVRMIPSYVQKVLAWPLPVTGKELRSFLGFTGYYRTFIKEYGFLTAEMNKLKNETVITWPDEVKVKFDKLKTCFEAEPVRGYPKYGDGSEPFILDTDFSSTNMACVLSQKQNGMEVFLGCCARKNNKAQAQYPSHKGELGAVVLGLQKFEHILRAKPFIIRTDSRCVQFLHTMKEYRGIWARWMCFIASFEFTIVHRKGTLQTNADALSRMPGLEEEAEIEAEEPGTYLADIDDIYSLNEELSKADVQFAAEEDSVMKLMIRYVKDQHKPDKQERKTLSSRGMSYVNIFECLLVKEDILYYQPPEINNEKRDKLLCLPISLFNTAFRLAHKHESSGHYGMNKTYERLRSRFFIPNLYSYVSAHISQCVPCITKKSTMGKPDHRQHHEQLSYVGQRLYVDAVGPFSPPCEFQGKMCRHFVTMQDGFSRYLVACPVETVDTMSMAEAILDKYVFIYGCPETIHSDRGSGFTSKLFLEIMS